MADRAARPAVDHRDPPRRRGHALGVDDAQVHGAARRALDQAPEVVPRRRAAVVTEDGHVHRRPRGHREQRGVHPILGARVLHEVAHPVRLAGRVVLRVLLQHHVGDPAGGVERDRGRIGKYVVHDDECRTDDHCRERDEQGRDTDRQRHQSPPLFFAAPGRTRLGRPPSLPWTPAGDLLRA